MAFRNPLVGYNDNLEHLGQVYHVQTEDSGGRRCHVITHLFADGGRIVTTTKTSYVDLVGEPDADERIRTLMRDQHRSMMAALRTGELDAMLTSAESSPTPPTPGVAPAAPSPVTGAGAVAAPAPAAVAPAPGLDELERAAAAAGGEFRRGLEPPPDRSANRPTPALHSQRRPTPLGAGSYRMIGDDAVTALAPEPTGSMPPPRKRRYRETNPGRLRTEPGGENEVAAAGHQTAAGPSDAFGARTITHRRLDQVVLEALSRTTWR